MTVSGQSLGDPGKRLHLAAVVLTAIAIGLIMAPAAHHREAERERVSRYFANYASLLITVAMAPLSIALAMEVSLVTFLVTGQPALGALIGIALMLFLVWLWYMFPAYRNLIDRHFPSRAATEVNNSSPQSSQRSMLSWPLGDDRFPHRPVVSDSQNEQTSSW
jgi:NhaP-type Na+/H+ or K+/H+ antiporter